MKKLIYLLTGVSLMLFCTCSKESPTVDQSVQTQLNPQNPNQTDDSSDNTSSTETSVELDTHVLDTTGDLAQADKETIKDLVFGKWEFNTNTSKNSCSVTFLEFTKNTYVIQIEIQGSYVTLTGKYTFTESDGKQIHLNNGFSPLASTIAVIDDFSVEEIHGKLTANLNFSSLNLPSHIQGCDALKGNYEGDKANPIEHASFKKGSTHSNLIKTWQVNTYSSSDVNSLYEFYSNFFCENSEDDSCPSNIKFLFTLTTYGSYVTSIQFGDNQPAVGSSRWEWANAEQTAFLIYPLEESEENELYRMEIVSLDENNLTFEEYPQDQPDFKATWGFVATKGESLDLELVVPDDLIVETEEFDNEGSDTSTSTLNALFETRIPTHPINMYAERKYIDTVTVKFINKSTGNIDKLEWEFGTQGKKTIINSAMSQPPVEFTFDLQNIHNINSFKVKLTAYDKDGNNSSFEKELEFPIVRTEGYIKIGDEKFEISPYKCTFCNYYRFVENENDEYTVVYFSHYYGTGFFDNVEGALKIRGALPEINNSLESTSKVIPEATSFPVGTKFYVNFDGYESIDGNHNNSSGIMKQDSKHPKVYSSISLSFKMKNTKDETLHDAELFLKNIVHKSVVSTF